MEKINKQYQKRVNSVKNPNQYNQNNQNTQFSQNYSHSTLQHPPPVPVNDYNSKSLPPNRKPPPVPLNPPTKNRPKKAPPPPPPGVKNNGTLRRPTAALPPPPPVPKQHPGKNIPIPPPPPILGLDKPQQTQQNHQDFPNQSNNFVPNNLPPPPPINKPSPPNPPSKLNKPKLPNNGDDSRNALLNSIQNFKSTNLRKAEDSQRQPTLRPVSSVSDEGDMADQLKKHLEKIRVFKEDSSSGSEEETDSEWDD